MTAEGGERLRLPGDGRGRTRAGSALEQTRGCLQPDFRPAAPTMPRAQLRAARSVACVPAAPGSRRPLRGMRRAPSSHHGSSPGGKSLHLALLGHVVGEIRRLRRESAAGECRELGLGGVTPPGAGASLPGRTAGRSPACSPRPPSSPQNGSVRLSSSCLGLAPSGP